MLDLIKTGQVNKMRKVMSIILVIFITYVCVHLALIYVCHKLYFRRSVDEYIEMQQISASKITFKSKPWFNLSGGHWERIIKVNANGKVLTYSFSMEYPGRSLTLVVYDRGNDMTSPKLEYPPLKYKELKN